MGSAQPVASHAADEAFTPAAARLWIAPADQPLLERTGLASFDSMMGTTAGRLLRSLPVRENWRLAIDDVDGGVRVMYLKKHRLRTWRSWLRARLGFAPGATAGIAEALNIGRLEAAGVPTMRLVACGERLRGDGLLESFLLTDELGGYVELDHYLRDRFSFRTAGGQRGRHELATLVAAVAELAARFHRAGFNHRDFYCCHFFIRQEASELRVNLIDLQRVEQRRLFRRRWIVKDLAQLAYSAPRKQISATQRMAFIKRYLGVSRLRAADKRLIRQVLRKQRRMERRLGEHP